MNYLQTYQNFFNPHLRPGRPRGPYFHGILSTEPSCEICPLRFKKRVHPDGPVPAKYALIGEEPGLVECKKGRGFTGPSGQLLWGQLTPQVGIVREDCWVTNTILCKSEKVKLSSNAIIDANTVKKMAAYCCYRRLIDELAYVDPVVCIPLGSLAVKALLRIANAGIYAYRGSRTEIDLKNLSEQLRRESYTG